MRIKIAAILLLLAFCMWNIYLVLGSENKLESRIPFRPEILISKEGHISYACMRGAMVISWFAIWIATSHRIFIKFSILFFGYLIDYVIYYNGTLFYVFNNIPVSYTLVMGVVMTFLIIKLLIYD